MADSLDDIDFFTQPPFANPQLRTQAINRFHTVVDHFQACEPTQFTNDNYNRPALIRYTWEYASSESQDRFLWAFFHWLRLGMADGDDMTLDDDLRSRLYAFAEDLMNNFFIPRKCHLLSPVPCLLLTTQYEPLGISPHLNSALSLKKRSGAIWEHHNSYPHCAVPVLFATVTAVSSHVPLITRKYATGKAGKIQLEMMGSKSFLETMMGMN
ncbi:hypothetical protein B0T25DRAFT_444933 [Lasiosphaeria hispida]|uniref:Uncharacterized protein n=1 Tax=Lasiosphaeria hispida TaxID=260671 RepID=A0AAJ0HWV3_9PEZI|nr:hypothetical protein B0T25DRAFT_444933 [Lasiosphaeria hispida]